MKVPVEIDLRRASFTLSQFEKMGYIILFHFEGNINPFRSASGTGGSSGPITPFQIMARAFVARASWGWDKRVILSRNCLRVSLSAPPADSSFIFLTSCETCTDSISGKLNHKRKRSCAARPRATYQKEKLENTSSTILQCDRLAWMCSLARSLRVGISY